MMLRESPVVFLGVFFYSMVRRVTCSQRTSSGSCEQPFPHPLLRYLVLLSRLNLASSPRQIKSSAYLTIQAPERKLTETSILLAPSRCRHYLTINTWYEKLVLRGCSPISTSLATEIAQSAGVLTSFG